MAPIAPLRRRLRSAFRTLVKGDSRKQPIGTGWFQRAGSAIAERGFFVGCPLEVFEYTAKDLLCMALMEGMSRDASVLDVGCGCLRGGYWFIRYLDGGKYHGIEPHVEMLCAGRELLLMDVEVAKSPRFSHNDDFDFSVFGSTFDFVVAFSIWTHASKPQIETMLDSFKRVGNPGAKFITSWVPPRADRPDYLGTTWVGRSHESDTAGVIAHSRSWIDAAVASRGLSVSYADTFTTLSQEWLVVTKR